MKVLAAAALVAVMAVLSPLPPFASAQPQQQQQQQQSDNELVDGLADSILTTGPLTLVFYHNGPCGACKLVADLMLKRFPSCEAVLIDCGSFSQLCTDKNIENFVTLDISREESGNTFRAVIDQPLEMPAGISEGEGEGEGEASDIMAPDGKSFLFSVVTSVRAYADFFAATEALGAHSAMWGSPATGTDGDDDDDADADADDGSSADHAPIAEGNVATFTYYNKFNDFLLERDYAFVMFMASWCQSCRATKPAFSAAADEFKGNLRINFATVDCAADSRACTRYTIKGYPTFLLFKNGNVVSKFTSARKKDSFVDFVADSIYTKEERLRQIERMDVEMKGQSMVLTEANKLKVLHTAPLVVTASHVPWCAHSTAFLPVWDEVVAHFQGTQSLAFALVDCSEEPYMCNLLQVKSYPSVTVSFNGKPAVAYTGTRTRDLLIQYIQAKHETFNRPYDDIDDSINPEN